MSFFRNTSKYIFHEGMLPEGVALEYEPAIFNLPEFSESQDPVRSVSFYVLDQKRSRAAAGIHFGIADHLARSPFKAPFGSVEFCDHINPEILYDFLEYIELQLRDQGVVDIFIRNPPRAYAAGKLSMLETFLVNRKYLVSDAEIAAVIDVTSKPFSGIIRPSEQLRIRQGDKAGLTFHQVDVSQLPEVFDFIARCHGEKGYKLPLTLEALEKAVRIFPDRYFLFIVRQDDAIAAASVSVRVNSNILYNFLTNHARQLNNLSPTVTLMEGIYTFCSHHNIKMFDLGTSMLHDKPKFPLLDFKLHVGGVPTSKLSFHKKIG